MQNEDGFLKNQLLTFKKIVAGEEGVERKERTKERGPGSWSTFFNFQGCFLGSSSSGETPLHFVCHLGRCPGLLATGVWTMDNTFIPGLSKRKKEPARHSPMPISLCYFLPLGYPWREGSGACLAQSRSGLPPNSFLTDLIHSKR